MDLLGHFQRVFRRAPEVSASAPGAVPILGDDTGHDSGLVLGVAAEQRVRVAAARRPDRRAYLRSLSAAGESAFSLDKPERSWGWADPVAAVVAALERSGRHVAGFELAVQMDMPQGAGLAAGAALRVASAAALDRLGGLGLGPMELARAAWQAEHELSGPSDSPAAAALSACGKEGSAVLVDCETMTHRVIPLALREYRVAIVDSGLARAPSRSEAEKPRAECEQALAALRARDPGIQRLRDVSESDLDALDERLRVRTRWVLEEAARASRAADAIEDGQISELGRLLSVSHEAFRESFGVQPPELDALVRLVQTAPGVVGARLSREGETGHVVCLVHESAIEPLRARVQKFYYERTSRAGGIYVVEAPGEGVEAESLG